MKRNKIMLFIEWVRVSEVTYVNFKTKQWFYKPTKEWLSDKELYELFLSQKK